MTFVRIGSGYGFEDTYGYSRLVRAGDLIFVSGTTARGADLEGDAYTQAKAAIAIIAATLAQADAQLSHVVRTVAYVTDLENADLVARAHLEAFEDHRPASTLVQVAALTPAAALVEIEVTAVLSG